MTQLPRLLDADLREARRLRPVSGSIRLALSGVSEADFILPDGDEAPPMHSLVELFTADGSAGVYRVTNTATNYLQETAVSLRHGIDTLADSTWRAQETFTGTVAEYLARLLSFQTARIQGVAPWQLGSVAPPDTVTKTLNYDRLSNLLSALAEDFPDYCFAYDQTSFPWTLSLVAKSAAVAAEFRLRRNAQEVSVTVDDSDLCNRLRVSANHTKTAANGSKTVDTAFFDYDNQASQSVWGVVERVADIDVEEDVKSGEHAETDAWAARFLAERAEPSVQIEVEGRALRALTGDDFDRITLGALCRVSLPDYNRFFAERVVSVTYSDPWGDPTAVRVSLANALPKFSETLAQIRDAARKAGRVASRAARDAEAASHWELIVQEIEEAVNGVGLRTLYETGIVLDAQSGATIYSLMEGLQALNAVLRVTHNGVGSVVTASGARLDADGQLILDEQGNPTFDTGANNLYTRVVQTATDLTTEVTNRQSADSALSSRITQEADRISLVVSGTGANAQVNGASIIAAINADGTSSATISADKIDLQGYVTATELAAGTITAISMSATTGGITTHSITVNGASSLNGGLYNTSWDSGGANFFLHGHALTAALDSGGILTLGLAAAGAASPTSATLDLSDFIADASVSGGTLTLTRADGTSLTFNKAVSLSGAWSSGVYTVSATSGAISGTAPSTRPHISLTGSGGDNFSAELLNETGGATGVTAVYGYLHQSGSTVGVYTSYSGGTYSGIIASLAVSSSVPPSSHISVESGGHYSPAYSGGGTQITSWVSTLRQAVQNSGYFYFDAWLTDDSSDKKRYYLKF